LEAYLIKNTAVDFSCNARCILVMFNFAATKNEECAIKGDYRPTSEPAVGDQHDDVFKK